MESIFAVFTLLEDLEGHRENRQTYHQTIFTFTLACYGNFPVAS